LATNASTLDHARRAAGGMLRETIICLHGPALRDGQFFLTFVNAKAWA
jgi:hypothetical protein